MELRRVNMVKVVNGCARELRRVNTVKVVNRRMDVPRS